jgi:UbiD family decarboxylase
MGKYSGTHIDSWGVTDMFGTAMDQDLAFVPCETIALSGPANAETVIKGLLQLGERVFPYFGG